MRSRSNARFLSAIAVALIALVNLPPPVRAATQELICSPSSLLYGGVAVGQPETVFIAVINTSQSSVTISSVSVSNRSFQVSKLNLPRVLLPGAHLEVGVTFAPTATGVANGQVTFASNASNPVLNLAVSGDGVTSELVTASPASVSFGNVVMGQSSTLPVVLTNTRSWSVILAGLHTMDSAFSVSGATFPLTLAARQSVTLNVTFKPRALGLIGGRSFISGPALTIPLTGIGASNPRLSVSPARLSFGNVAEGGTETLTTELSAHGGSVTISSASSSSSQFAVTDATFPLTIPAGQAVSLNVTFTPQQGGTQWATLSFVGNAENSPTSETLTGTGTVPYVTLSWNASTSEGVTGYNIYRKTSPTGSYTRINSSLDPDTTYNDTTVTGPTVYYYATTTVNAKGMESGYSNRVKVRVP